MSKYGGRTPTPFSDGSGCGVEAIADFTLSGVKK